MNAELLALKIARNGNGGELSKQILNVGEETKNNEARQLKREVIMAKSVDINALIKDGDEEAKKGDDNGEGEGNEDKKD